MQFRPRSSVNLQDFKFHQNRLPIITKNDNREECLRSFDPKSTVAAVLYPYYRSYVGLTENQIIIIERMFDQFYCNEENSLDLLLKFSTESQQPLLFEDYPFDTDSKPLPPTSHHINTLIDLLTGPLDSPLPLICPNADYEIHQMRSALQEQEEKVAHLSKHNRERPRSLLLFKRKASECTEAPNSPTRKTKHVRKEKP